MRISSVTKAWIGGAGCVAFAAVRGADPRGAEWAQVVLVFAALVLVPLALELLAEPEAEAGERADGAERRTPNAERSPSKSGGAVAAVQAEKLMRWAETLQLPAGLLLAVACALERGAVALWLTLPWMGFTALLAGAGFARMQRGGLRRELHLLAADVALLFSAIGGAWTLADRGGFRPMGFDPYIVALTAVHFHFAGLLLPLFAGLAQQQLWMSRMAARAVVGAVLGVPAVAVGITGTQLGWNPAIEAAAGCALALAGMAVAVLHVRLALDAKWSGATRALLGVAGVSLFFAMVLAAMYASRAFVPAAGWLGLVQMQILHGTANALGFALCGLLGWRRAVRSGHAGPAL